MAKEVAIVKGEERPASEGGPYNGKFEAHSHEWLCHTEKKEFNAPTGLGQQSATENTELTEQRSRDWRQGLRGRGAEY